MFTGLIEEVGAVRGLSRTADGARLQLACTFAKELRRGDSIAVDGACLTAIELAPDAFSAEVSNETLARTTLGNLRPGSRVNLERALAVGSRLGGHHVLGHVDAVGRIASIEGLGDARRVDIEFPPELAPLIVPKGSITVDGISLTVNDVGNTSFWLAIIPETQQRTTLTTKTVGAAVNLEGDILGKYVLRVMALQQQGARIDEAFLRRHGYL
jgi:riboflavin synthase